MSIWFHLQKNDGVHGWVGCCQSLSRMTSVTDTKPSIDATTKAPMMNDPFIAYNLIKGQETEVTETWIKLGWKLFKWLEARKDKSFTTDITMLSTSGLTFRIGSEEGYNSQTRVLTFSSSEPTKFESVPFNIERELASLYAECRRISVVKMANNSILSLTRTIPAKDKIQLYTSHLLGRDLTFKASNGVMISIGHWRDRYCSESKRLYVSTPSNVTDINSDLSGFSKLMEDWESVQLALQEFDRSHTESVTSGSIDFSGWMYPGVVNTDPSSVMAITPVHMTRKLYGYARKHFSNELRCEFRASNGIIIDCRDACLPGYGNGNSNTLYIDRTVLGKDWIPTEGCSAYKRDLTKIQVALKELEEKYTQHKKSKRPVRISKQVYEYVKNQTCHEFQASNGIKVVCYDLLSPGFEACNNSDVLDINQTVVDQDWIPKNGRTKYYANVDRVQAAIEELNALVTVKPIHISQEAYAYGMTLPRGDFKASNGIVIICDCISPGFENPGTDCLYVNQTVIDVDWIPQINQSQYHAKMSRVLEAVQELEAKYKASIPIPVVPSVESPAEPKSKVDEFRGNMDQLVAMGFSRDDAIRGLVESGNDMVEAIKELLAR